MTQQEESAYCFRLVRLLIDIGSDVLRDVLLKTIHPYTLTMFVQNNINRIKYLKQRKLLFKDQYDLLTKSSAVQPAALDITLLCWIFRNLCNISPTKGWETPPGSTDQGLGDDIFRLQTFRNTIHGHITTTRVTAADFQTKWTELEELIIRLTKHGTPMIQQNTSVRISEIRFQDLDPESTRKIIEILNSWKKHEEMWETIKKKLEKQEEVLEIQGKRLGKQEEQLKKHGEKLEKQDKQLEKQAEQQGEQGKQLRRHGEQLDKDTKQLGHQKEQLQKHDKQLEKQDEQLEKQDEQLGIHDEHLEGHREQLQHQDERLRTVEHKVTGILEEQQHRNTLPTTEDEHLSESKVAPLIQQNVEGTNVQIENNNAMFLKHGLNLLDDEDETDASSPFQRFNCVIVLMYFWLKEEIPKSTATYVANGLYQAQNGQNGLISDPHYERIIECRRRRQQVDLLLKYILRSTKETYACFVQLLRNSEDGHIAKSLDECIPTATQIQEFNQLQLFSLGKAVRPDCHCPRFIMQEGEFQMLCYMLNDVTTIETIADYFLSKFFFSVREHTNITSCPSKDEQRITSLLRTMTECSNKIRTALKEVLDLLKMGHVFTHLSETRRYPSDQEIMEDSNLPTKLLDGQVERSITEAFQAEPMDLRMKALKEIPFEVEEMETGSILIRLRPVSKNAWQIFEEKCYSGDIKYFIASVYDSEKLDEGRYEIDVKIYQELCSDEDDCVRATIYLTDKFETEMGGAMAMKLHELQLSNDGKSDLKAGALKRKESYISRHMDLLCEEMDVSTSLLSYLSQHEIIDDSVKEMLKRIKGRAEKVRYLLTELSMESRAEDMLKRFIQKTDMCLFEDIESMENAKSPDKIRRSGKVSDETEMKDGRVPVNGSTQKHTTRRLFFSAVAILIVTKRGSIPNKAVKTDNSTKDNLQLWCSKLVDPVFYVKGKTCQSGFPSLPSRANVHQVDTERSEGLVSEKQLLDIKVHSSSTNAGKVAQSTKPKRSYSQVTQTFSAKKATIVNYINIPQSTEQNEPPLSREESQMNEFLNAVKGFKSGHHVLVTCGAQPDAIVQNIGKVPWTVVFDFDPNSRANGLLSQAEVPIMKKRSLHIRTWRDKSVITEESTNWIFMQGIKDQPDTQTDKKFQKWKKQTQSGIDNIIVQMEKFGKSYTNYYVVVLWPLNQKLSSHVKHLVDELENLELCDFVIVVEKVANASDISETLFKQMQEDYEKKPTIFRLSIKDVCLAISHVFKKSAANKNTKFDLPTFEPSYIGINDQQAQWLKEDLEVLYEASPYDFEYSLDKLKEETDNFYRGGNWPWYMWYETGGGQVDVERAIMKDIIGSLKQYHIEVFKSGRVTICHAPGSGGTTLAQRILWELHKDTPCVQVKLRTGSSDVASRIQLLYEKTRLPILILLDGEDEQRVDVLARDLREIVFVILYVKRYPYPMEGKRNSKSCFWLKRFVTRQESINIAHKFLHQCETEGTKAAVEKLHYEVETEGSEHEIFEFGLATYKHHYKGVESYVNGFLQLENNSENKLLPWQYALGILSLVYFYGQMAMPCKFFSKLLEYSLLTIDDFPLEMEALIMKDTNDGRANMVRISHYLVAKEILEQILSRPRPRGDRVAELCYTAKRKLEPFAVNFIRLAAKSGAERSAGIIEKIMTRTFISRDNKAAAETDLVDRPRYKPQFAQILHDVSSQAPYTERFRILEELVKSFPNEPQFLAHLGRLYSLCRPEEECSAEKCFIKALDICDKEIGGLAIDDISHSMRLTLMHIYHMYGNMFLTRVSKYTGKSFEDMPVRNVADDKVKNTLSELFPMVRNACGYFSKCRDVTPTGLEESHGFLGEIKIRLMFCDFVFRRNLYDDIYSLIHQFEDSEIADFVEDTISIVDELVLECLSVVDPAKIEQELQYCQTWFASLFKTHKPWNVVFRTQETVKSRRLQITARKLLYQKKKVFGVLEEVTSSSDIEFIVKNYEANFKDIHDNGIESPRKAIDLDYREWLFAIRHKHLRITYTLEDVLKQVRLWHEKVQTPSSRFYLFILCSLLGFQGNTALLIEAQQHKDDLLKQSKYVTKPKYPREMLGAGPGICCLTPGTRFFGLIEGREIKGNFNSDSVKVMIGTICGPNDKPAAGYIRLDLGQDHLIGVNVFFVPVRSDMKGPAYTDMRVEFYVGFSIAHGYEAYNVRQLKKLRCRKCGIYLEARSKSRTKCKCGEVIKSD